MPLPKNHPKKSSRMTLMISKIRIESGLTQQMLAEKAGVKINRIWAAERGNLSADDPAMVKIANALLVDDPSILTRSAGPEFLKTEVKSPAPRPSSPKPPPPDLFEKRTMGNNLRRRGNFTIYLSIVRIERGLTQKGLAILLGISSAYLSRIERGKCHPSDSLLEKMSIVLDCQKDSLMSDVSIKTVPQKGPSNEDLERAKETRGVYWDVRAQKWNTCVYDGKRSRYLGRFDRIEDAIAAVEKFRQGGEKP